MSGKHYGFESIFNKGNQGSGNYSKGDKNATKKNNTVRPKKLNGSRKSN